MNMNMKIVICWEKKSFFVSRVTTHHKWDLLNLKRAVDVVCIARITLPLFSLYPAVLCTMWKSAKGWWSIVVQQPYLQSVETKSVKPCRRPKESLYPCTRLMTDAHGISYCLNVVLSFWSTMGRPALMSTSCAFSIFQRSDTHRAPLIASLHCIFAAQCKAQ